jgi:very-short-patch-repair endonuclease/endogenous inhibitor of DNA gyrase (YacG/DUF329 family)
MSMVTHECAYCHTIFERDERPSKPKHKRYFCNMDCFTKWRQESPEYRNPKTLQTITCDNCGKQRKLNRNDSDTAINRFCSHKCQYEWLAKNGQPATQNRVYFNCEICGKEYGMPKCHSSRAKHHFCSRKCQGEWMSTQTGKENPRYKHVEVTCYTCAKVFLRKPSRISYNKNNFCSRECLDLYLKTDEAKEFNRNRMLETLSAYPRKTKPEKLIQQCLKKSKISFEEQKIINKRFCVDFFIEDDNSKGIVVEVLGDYFHCNPDKYDEPINKMQKQNLANDKRRYNYLTKCGYAVFGIWEHEILENPKISLSQVFNYIQTSQTSLIDTFEHIK